MSDRKYGWIPDLPDYRDYQYSAPRDVLKALPPTVDLRPQCPPVTNQLSLGSCTGQMGCGIYAFIHLKQGQKPFTPSPLFLYYNNRKADGTVSIDAGSSIKGTFQQLSERGVCREETWPYKPERFAQQPPSQAYDEALNHQAIEYSRVAQDLDQLRGCLAEGFPIGFGFTVYPELESQEVAASGILPMPKPGKRALGGHAVAIVGYMHQQQWFIVRNSWGEGWGKGGYFVMPYSYVLNPGLATDFWTVRKVESPIQPTPAPPVSVVVSGLPDAVIVGGKTFKPTGWVQA